MYKRQAYVYDEDGQFASRCNTAMVSLEKVHTATEQQAVLDRGVWHRVNGEPQADETLLRKLVEEHHKWTGSLQARHIMDHWAASRAKFVKVFPNEYKRALGEQAAKAAAAKAIQDAGGAGTKAKSQSVPAK